VAGDLRQPRLDEEPDAVLHQNALFAGHDDGAENWAILASLIETCKRNWPREAQPISTPPRKGCR
jgi:hypothetical protein